jgi:hypothetical protein
VDLVRDVLREDVGFNKSWHDLLRYASGKSVSGGVKAEV